MAIFKHFSGINFKAELATLKYQSKLISDHPIEVRYIWPPDSNECILKSHNQTRIMRN